MTELTFEQLPVELRDILRLMDAQRWYYALTFWADDIEPLVQAGWLEKECWGGVGGLRYRITDLGLARARRLA